MVAQSLLDDVFSNGAAAVQAVASATIDALAEVPLRSWVIIGLLLLVAQLVWSRRSR